VLIRWKSRFYLTFPILSYSFLFFRIISYYFVLFRLINLYLYCYGVRREPPFHLKVFCVFLVFSEQQKEVVAKRLPLFI
jgi:hypothetical protein